MGRGRPKASVQDTRSSYGPLSDLIRSKRIALGLGLSDVAKACGCSVQFISNIEHGRAPLPWAKLEAIGSVLQIEFDELRVANLAMRADVGVFMKTKKPLIMNKLAGVASAVALATKDSGLQDVIQRYQRASVQARKKVWRTAIDLLGRFE